MPASATVPSSNSRPTRVTPCGTRLGGVNFGSGFFGSGAQSLRACDTSTNPARMVKDGCPVKFVITRNSSRSEGTSSRSTSEKIRSISIATLRLSLSACTKSTAERNRDWRNVFGHASGTCIFNSSTLWLSVSSSNAAAASANRMMFSESYGQSGSDTSTGFIPSFFTVSSAARSTAVAGAACIHAGMYPTRRREISALESNASLHGTLATSVGSGPLMAWSTSIVSSTDRAIGPSLSQLQLSVIAPVRGTRP